MTLETFTASVARGEQPPELPPALRALWLDETGNWAAAHELAGEIETPDGARIHAYLHRKEGDTSNAGYWYRRASREMFTGSLDDEWTHITEALLEQ